MNASMTPLTVVISTNRSCIPSAFPNSRNAFGQPFGFSMSVSLYKKKAQAMQT
jgi:hypothetical protein